MMVRLVNAGSALMRSINSNPDISGIIASVSTSRKGEARSP